MQPIHIINVSSPCTRPDWNGTVREQTNNHSGIHLDSKRRYIHINFYLSDVNPPFQKS